MEVIKKGFEEKYGIPFDSFMALDLAGTPNAVSYTHLSTSLAGRWSR